MADPQPAELKKKKRTPTATSSFGVSRREGHDATDFYSRFTPPELSDDETVNETKADLLIQGDARKMDAVADNSVALG